LSIGIVGAIATAPLSFPLGLAVGIGLSLVSTLLGWQLTGFGVFGGKPELSHNYGLSKHLKDHGNAVGHFLTFDVYVAPNSTGTFTARSQHHSRPATGGDIDYEVTDSTTARPIWKISIDSPEPPGSQDAPSTTAEGATTIPEFEKFSAKIEAASFSSNVNEKVISEGGNPKEAIVEPHPKPGIAGPFRNVPEGENVQYSADQTVIAGSHVEEYRWYAYRLSTDNWLEYLTKLVDPGRTGEELTEMFEPEDDATGKLAEIEYEHSGRYLLVLEVEDGKLANRTEDGAYYDGTVTRTMEIVDVNTEPPDPEIVTPESASADETLGFDARQTTDPESSRSELDFDWILFGPVPESVVDDGLSSPDELFELMLSLGGFGVEQKAGEYVEIPAEDTRAGVYFAVLTVTDDSGSWATTIDTVTVEEGEYELAWDEGTHVFRVRRPQNDQNLSVVLEAEDGTDFDLFATFDGRDPSPQSFDRRSASGGPNERIQFGPDELGSTVELKVGVNATSGKGNYYLRPEDAPHASLEFLGGDGTPQDDDA
jgi:hypothetical protein